MVTPEKITVSTDIAAPLAQVWKYWTDPAHITQWNFASPDWHCPSAKNDLRVGGRLCATMAARDGSASFDFEGTYTELVPLRKIAYTIADGRTVDILFDDRDGKTFVTETFEAENVHSIDLQRAGWQAILDNFKKHCEQS